MAVPQLQLIEHLLSWSTTVITHTREPQRLIHAGGLLETTLFLLHGHGVGIGADPRQHQRQHLPIASAAPPEQTMGEGIAGIPGQLVGAEPTHPRCLSHRGQTCPETEAVGEPGQVVSPFRKLTATGLLPAETASSDAALTSTQSVSTQGPLMGSQRPWRLAS